MVKAVTKIPAALDLLIGIANSPEAAAAFLGAIFTSVVTIVGFGLALKQIRSARRQYEEEVSWKRSEYVRSLLSEIRSSPNVELVFRVLDYRSGSVRIPEQFQPLFAERRRSSFCIYPWNTNFAADTYFEIVWSRFVQSLELERDQSQTWWREPDIYTYRTCFETLCVFIMNVAADERLKKVSPSEYADLSYYCHLLVFPKPVVDPTKDDAAKRIRRYVEHYFDKATFDLILFQAEAHANGRPGEHKPSDFFSDRFENNQT